MEWGRGNRPPPPEGMNMKKVKFLRDFRGILTGEVYKQAGETMELSKDAAAELVKQGVVELVAKAKPKAKAKAKAIDAGT